MAKKLKIRRGLTIRLKGTAQKICSQAPFSVFYAISMADFPIITPRLKVSEGSEVMSGDVLFCVRGDETVCVTSPVAGIVEKIERGDGRAVRRIIIRSAIDQTYRYFNIPSVLNRENVRSLLLQSGLWAYFKTRPFDTIPRSDAQARDIFITSYHTAPLSPDTQYSMSCQSEDMQRGVNTLCFLTDGKIFMNMDASVYDNVFDSITGTEKIYVSGPHPAGNVGVMINHVAPVNKGETVFTISCEDVALIGAFMRTGEYFPMRKIALTGSSVKNPKYMRTLQGAQISELCMGRVVDAEKTRFITGNVLSGRNEGLDGFLGFYDTQITAIPEGNDDSALFGWIAPRTDRFSMLRAGTFSYLLPFKEYTLNTSTNGEERNFVLSGIYRQVFPMDIYPMELVKAAIVADVPLLEKMGIYEVAPEDFALCSFVCPSKIQHQRIIRAALDMVYKENTTI
ncbi:MAG: Na(+)-translocating NADH-quinone reductase subunit A [Flavobacteriales bacterium]|nr:Na(+)-translocating NADH-quinone reductase subunit A [Flavobacteriales bacterium]